MLSHKWLSVLALFTCVTLSLEENPKDCLKGKQYWSTSFINPSGACVACPPNYRNCRNEPYEDQKRCEDSCRVVDITKKASSTSTKLPLPPTSSYPKATPSSTRHVGFYSLANIIEPNEDEPRSNNDGDRSRHWQISLQAVVASILSSCAVVCLVVLGFLVRARRKKQQQKQRRAGGNSGEGLPLNEIPNNADEEQCLQPDIPRQETEPPVQCATTSTSGIVGIQEEDNFQSSLNIQTENEN